MKISKDDLADMLFKENLISKGRTGYSFEVDFAKTMQNENVAKFFIADIVETFNLAKSHLGKNVKIMFSDGDKDLIRLVSNEIDADHIIHGKNGHMSMYSSDSDIVYIGYCISRGTNIRDAELKLRDLNQSTHIAFGIYLFDRQRWAENLAGLGIDIYSTLNWRDFARAYDFPARTKASEEE